jgi:uncharacterized DUF497 family protein
MPGFDPEKRSRTIEDRGLDFIDAAALFDGPANAHCSIKQERRGQVQVYSDG